MGMDEEARSIAVFADFVAGMVAARSARRGSWLFGRREASVWVAR